MRGDAIGPGTVVVRTMVVATRSPSGDAGWSVLPGGLGRVVREDQPVLVQRRGTAKDVWVRGRRPGPPGFDVVGPPGGRPPGRPPHLAAEPRRRGPVLGRSQHRAGRGDVPAGARARAAVRAVARAGRAGRGCVAHPLAGRPAGGERRRAGDERGRRAGRAPDGAAAHARRDRRWTVLRRELAAALGDRPGGLGDSLSHLARSAGSVREFLSTSTWRVVGDARRRPSGADAPTPPRPTCSWWPSRSTTSCSR